MTTDVAPRSARAGQRRHPASLARIATTGIAATTTFAIVGALALDHAHAAGEAPTLVPTTAGPATTTTPAPRQVIVIHRQAPAATGQPPATPSAPTAAPAAAAPPAVTSPPPAASPAAPAPAPAVTSPPVVVASPPPTPPPTAPPTVPPTAPPTTVATTTGGS